MKDEGIVSLAPALRIPGPTYKWWVVGMLWFICFFNYADRMAINAVAKVLKSDYQLSNADFGWIASAFMFVYALSAPFAGQVGDKFARKVLILGGLVVWSAVTSATALCRRFWEFVFVRGTEGLGETFYFPATMSLISDYHTKKTRSLAMGLHQTSVYVGTIGGTTLAGLLAERYGWQSPFLIFGVAGATLGIILAIFLREPSRNEAERLELGAIQEASAPPAVSIGQFLEELVRTPSAVLLLAAFFGANSVALVFITWMPNYLTETFGMSLAMAGFSATFYLQTASVIGSVVGGVLADGARQRFAGGRMLAQSLGALLGIPFIYLSGSTTDVTRLVLFLTLFGFAKGIYDANIWASMYDVIRPSRRATMLGLANMIGWAGAAVATSAIGEAITHFHITMGQALSSTAGIYGVVALILIVAGVVFAPRDIRHAQAPVEHAAL
jgi:MFS family permease